MAETDSFRAVIRLPDMAATATLGANIAALLAPGDVVALDGDLGMGKTALARAILRALGVTESVPSPTFTLVQSYETSRFAVSHYDLYRLNTAEEIMELGLDEALEDGAALIEWPARAIGHLPADRLTVHLSLDGGNRHAALEGPARWRRLESLHV